MSKNSIVRAAESAAFIFRAQPKLVEWTALAAEGFALYSAANDALRDRLNPQGDVSQLADAYRRDTALMAAMRAFSLFDRDAEVSFQVVNRHLQDAVVHDLLVNNLVGQNEHARPMLEGECRQNIASFLEAYATLDVKALGRLQHFRNIGLAHISFTDLRKFIRYDDLRQFIALAGTLAGALTLATHRHNIDIVMHMEEIAKDMRQRWIGAIRREAPSNAISEMAISTKRP